MTELDDLRLRLDHLERQNRRWRRAAGALTLAGMTPPHIDCEYLEVRDVELDDLPTRLG